MYVYKYTTYYSSTTLDTLYCITQGIQQTLEFEKSTHVDSNFFKSSFGLQIIVLILNSMTTNDIDRLILNHAVRGKA